MATTRPTAGDASGREPGREGPGGPETREAIGVCPLCGVLGEEEACGWCAGAGRVPRAVDPCPACDGAGTWVSCTAGEDALHRKLYALRRRRARATAAESRDADRRRYAAWLEIWDRGE